MQKYFAILLTILFGMSPVFAAAQAGAGIPMQPEIQKQGAGIQNPDNIPEPKNDTKPKAKKPQPKAAAPKDKKPTTTEATSTQATSTKPAWGQKGGIIGYIKSLFGLTGSTTADVRDAMNASTSASTTSPQGVGFFARLLGLFGGK